MSLSHKTAEQLRKMIRRRFHRQAAAYEWAERIARGPFRLTLTKKKQRELGILPQVGKKPGPLNKKALTAFLASFKKTRADINMLDRLWARPKVR